MNKPGNKDLSRRLPRWRPAAPCLGSVYVLKGPWSLTAARSRCALSGRLSKLGRPDSRGLPVGGPQTRCTGSRPTRASRSARPGTLSGRYLSVEEILAAARTAGADGGLPRVRVPVQRIPIFAEGCARAGITFVGAARGHPGTGGPTRLGRSPRHARRGLPVMASSEPSR